MHSRQERSSVKQVAFVRGLPVFQVYQDRSNEINQGYRDDEPGEIRVIRRLVLGGIRNGNRDCLSGYRR